MTQPNTNLLGVHCSVAGGAHCAFDEADRLGITCFQIFTKNQKQWRNPELKPEVVEQFREKLEQTPVQATFSHASYLINLASSDEEMWQKSKDSMVAEIERCEELGLKFTVFHPGFGKGLGEDESIARIAEALKEIFDRTSGSSVNIACENTAGQGTSIGGKLEHLQAILEEVKSPRLGVCFDTCHAFAAGYDIRNEESTQLVLSQLQTMVGEENLLAFHLNDSKGKLGSHLDRHEHIAQGELGEEPFKYIVRNFPHIPKVLETAKNNDMDAKNLKLLRSFI